ncbi:MAG TPA: dTDP-4-dehydrorhamnose reductase [Salinimicrobium sp.]|nr:dTDP-4-dehydrorhamnose reductase [Salinimicrobium sp.]
MKKVLVTGAAGQLGKCIQKFSSGFPEIDFTFKGSDSFDLTLYAVVSTFLRENQFDYCINCAAYTNVEKAENEREMAYLVNSKAVKNLAEICEQNNIVLIHFSTDYVFDGEKKTPYSEEDEANPLNIYGASKLSGEECIEQMMNNYFIFRTSWLYSEFGSNFLINILKKAKEETVLNITAAQKGTPTNANDLARFVLKLISEGNTNYGIYHYSNLGEATWYDFAEEILKLSGNSNAVVLNKTDNYKTQAARPNYSVLSKEKVQMVFGQNILHWKDSLAQQF